MNDPRTANERPLVTWGEVAAYLKVSEKTARRFVVRNKIPRMWIGRCVAIYASAIERHYYCDKTR